MSISQGCRILTLEGTPPRPTSQSSQRQNLPPVKVVQGRNLPLVKVNRCRNLPLVKALQGRNFLVVKVIRCRSLPLAKVIQRSKMSRPRTNRPLTLPLSRVDQVTNTGVIHTTRLVQSTWVPLQDNTTLVPVARRWKSPISKRP